RDLAKTPVRVLGYGEISTTTSMAGPDDLIAPVGAAAARGAFAMAGLAPSDVGVIEVYDSFTITVLLAFEALGFCAPGEAAWLVQDGAIRPGGRLPLNTSGGGLSYCHPGQFGVLLLVEAVRQLRGECGARQVPGAEVAAVHGVGGVLSTQATVILG